MASIIDIIFLYLLISFSLSSASCFGTTKCLLLALPGGDLDEGEMEREKDANVSDIRVVTVNSEVKFAIPSFVVSTLGNVTGSECSEVIGVVGDVDSKTAGILHTLASRSNLSLTIVSAVAPSTFLPVTHLPLPNVLDMRPLSHYLQAIVSFIQQWNWTRIGLISDDSYYYQYAAELLMKQLSQDGNKVITPLITVTENGRFSDTLDDIRQHKTYVSVILSHGEFICSLLDETAKHDLTWPEYAWLILDVNGESTPCTDSSMEGVIQVSEKLESDADASANDDNFTSELQHATTLAFLLSYVSNTISSTRGFREGRRLFNISFLQVSNGSTWELALYDPDIGELTVTHNISSRPEGITLVVYPSRPEYHVFTVLTVFTLSCIFLSVVLLLYLYFRKEPEIRATSVTVSLCMFLGSYLMLLNIPIQLAEVHPSTYPKAISGLICNLLAWLSALGLSNSLILSTLFVKILRVYVLFCKPLSYRKKLFSDKYLLFYVVLMVSPNLLFLTMWSALDPSMDKKSVVLTEREVVVTEVCGSKHTLIWLCLLLLYFTALLLAVIILAFKTSKVRFKNFRDTKATNAYAFLTVFFIVSTLAYWLFFSTTDSKAGSAEITLYVGHTIIGLLCPLCLFVPKLIPPLKRSIRKQRKEQK